MKTISITNELTLGVDSKCFIIAEAGVNHNGDLDMALKLVDVAADAGADAIKFQTFKAENIITKNAPKAQYHIETTGSDKEQSWYELLKTQELTREMHLIIQAHCVKKNILFLSTPYDIDSAKLLNDLGVPLFKVASTDTNNILFLEQLAEFGKPIILSTAMATVDEIETSVLAIKSKGMDQIVLLQCTGNYPSNFSDANLLTIKTLASKFNLITGYSDHVMGIYSAVAAVALGAKVYEKHFTLDKNLPGPDHRASLSPSELREVIKAVRETEAMMGDGKKRVMDSEKANREILRKRIVAARDIEVGHVISADDLRVVRAGAIGLDAGKYYQVLGSKAVQKISSQAAITEAAIKSN